MYIMIYNIADNILDYIYLSLQQFVSTLIYHNYIMHYFDLFGSVSQPVVGLHSRRRLTGTMINETGASQFYTKYSIIPISDIDSSNVVTDECFSETGRMKKLTSPLGDRTTMFPKLEDCAHFHYELVELGKIEVSLVENTSDLNNIYINVRSGDIHWTIHRTYESMHQMDVQLHRCIFDRKFSLLPELSRDLLKEAETVDAMAIISAYLIGFSYLAGNMLNCGPVLSWFEMDNHGSRLVGSDSDAAINTPAVGAALAIQAYKAKHHDELSFEVNDMLSIIDKPPPTESTWWRGKRNFEVGFFPCEFVELICDNKISEKLASKLAVKPVLCRNTKFISELRAFFSSRPQLVELQRTGIVKQRVFGCDLGEHLLNSSRDVPLVLMSCAAVIESHGLVDGIYRLSGVVSNIQKLRNEFDMDRAPSFTDEVYLQDIHSISSLLKMYFRELPNPLFTYQLYSQFAYAEVSSRDEDAESKLETMRSIIQQLPPPHYRTAEFLLRHLALVASRAQETSMTSRNLSIVWAPNLLRCKDLDQLQLANSGVAALKGVGLQAIVIEFLIENVAEIFDKSRVPSSEKPIRDLQTRMRSSAMLSPKLLSLEEAQLRAGKYIEVGAGSSALPVYHTVIDLPRGGRKSIGGWRSLFTRTRSVSLKDEEPPNQTVTTRSTTGDRKKISEESSGPVAVASGTVSLGVMTQSTESLTATLVAHQITENDDPFSDEKARSNSCDIACESDGLPPSEVSSTDAEQLLAGTPTSVPKPTSGVIKPSSVSCDPPTSSSTPDSSSSSSDAGRILQISTISGQYIGERILAPVAAPPPVSQTVVPILSTTSGSVGSSGAPPPQTRARSTFQPDNVNPLPRVHPVIQSASSLPPGASIPAAVSAKATEEEIDDRYKSFLAWNSSNDGNLFEDFKNTLERRLGQNALKAAENSTGGGIVKSADGTVKDLTSPSSTNEKRILYRLTRRSHDYADIDESKILPANTPDSAPVSVATSGYSNVGSSVQNSSVADQQGTRSSDRAKSVHFENIVPRNTSLKPLSNETILSWKEKIVPDINFHVVEHVSKTKDDNVSKTGDKSALSHADKVSQYDTDNRSSVTDNRSAVTDNRSAVTDNRSSVTSNRSSVHSKLCTDLLLPPDSSSGAGISSFCTSIVERTGSMV